MYILDDKCLDGVRETVDGASVVCPVNGIGSCMCPSTFLTDIITDRAGAKGVPKSRSNRSCNRNSAVI